MTITYHAGRRIQGLSTDVSVDFTDNFSSDNFTDINTGVSVSSATMTFNGASNADRRSYKAFSNNISDTTWTVKFTSNFSNLGSTPAGGANVHLCALSDSNLELNGSTQDMVSIMFDNSGTVFGAYKDGSGSYTNSSVTPRISISAGTTYYWTFERTSTTNIKISCYSDSGRTTHVSNSPYNYTIPSTIQNLSYIQFAIVNVGGGGTPIGTVDDLEVIDDGTKYFPTNVQSGSRFEETDTRKIYYAGGFNKSGCKAYYNFEQTSGSLTNIATTANGFADGLGSTVDGINNGATSTTGKVGSYAWNFASDNLQLSTSTSNWNFLHNGNSYSIAMWIKFTNTGNSEYILSDIESSSSVGMILSKINNKFQYIIYRGVQSTSVLSTLSTTTISDTDWHHFALTFDGTTGKMYVDGSLDSTQTKTNSVSTANSSYSLKLGSEGSGVSFFNGNVDELAIFNRVLTADEVSYLYNSGTGRTVNSTDLLGWTEEV